VVPSEQLRVRRQPALGLYDRAAVLAVLDASLFAHVAFLDDEQPYCVPFLHARVGDALYLHGAVSSRAIRALVSGAPACVTATILDGLVLARSLFASSVNYRSVMIFGTFRLVPDEEREQALEALSETLVPGRWAEVRPPSRKELKATSLLTITLDHASVKVRSGPPCDDDESSDDAADVWAGVVPLEVAYGIPQPAPELSPDTPLPSSVRRLVQDETS
jgi:uncharacterized protein